MKLPLKILPLLFLFSACTPVAPIGFSITSTAFSENGRIPQVYTCDGENSRPPLTITGVPEATESIAILMEDPDSPSGLFTHWTAWNIDPKLTIIGSDDPLAGAIEGTNSKGTFGYIGPCPTSGTHRYIIRAFALNRTLGIPSTTTPEELKKKLIDSVIAQTEMTGVYQRTSGGTDSSTGTGTKTLPGSTIIE